MAEKIDIVAGEMAVGKDEAIIRTGGIGSCIVVCLYDRSTRSGGMVHAMLPSIKPFIKVASFGKINEIRYADRAIERLLAELERMGVSRQNLTARLVGGAEMIRIFSLNSRGLGRKNLDAARAKLSELGITIEGEDVGGTIGRLAEFNLKSGVLDVSTKM